MRRDNEVQKSKVFSLIKKGSLPKNEGFVTKNTHSKKQIHDDANASNNINCLP